MLKYASQVFAEGAVVDKTSVSGLMDQEAYRSGLLHSGYNGFGGPDSVDGHLKQIAADRFLVATGKSRVVYPLPADATPETLLERGTDA